jgi:hypothetical protein
VGVMANALKAFFNITQAHNIYYKNPNTKLSKYDDHFNLSSIVIDGKRYYVHSAANLKITNDQWVEINAMAAELMGENVQLLRTKKDVSIILAAFTSLATDNAKLLGLAKLNANIHLASMLTYLASMGFDFEIIKKFARSRVMTALAESLKQDPWITDHAGIGRGTWDEFLRGLLKDDEEALREIEQVRKVYNAAQELRDFTAVLGINQGLKNSLNDAAIFSVKFSSMFTNQLDRLGIDFTDMLDDTKRDNVIDLILSQRQIPHSDEYKQFLSNQIDEVIGFLKKYNFTG